jgi:hypothetical protein
LPFSRLTFGGIEGAAFPALSSFGCTIDRDVRFWHDLAL